MVVCAVGIYAIMEYYYTVNLLDYKCYYSDTSLLHNAMHSSNIITSVNNHIK